jgi:hypothetical protein
MKAFSTLALILLATAQAMSPKGLPLPALRRGGAGPIAPTSAAKIAGTFCLVQGTYSALAPSKSFPYGEYNITQTNANLIREIGLSFLNMGVHVYGLIFKGYGIKVSSAINALIWVADCLYGLLNDKSKTTGKSKAADITVLAVNSAVAIAALNDLPYFSTTLKAESIFVALSSLSCIVSPTFGMKIWEIENDDEYTPGFVSLIGNSLGFDAVLLASLAWGMEPITAIGYTAAVATILSLKTHFFTPEVARIGMNKKVLAIWPVIGAITALSILL